jgi:3-hydroxyisobutyrate dehydrogenase-like beta-hydroxyacid dehydrogenase
MTTAAATTSVSVLGLGAMGRALAQAFRAAGHTVTVWNRTPARAEELRGAGFDVSATVAEAVAASDLVVICVLDTAAVEAVLDAARPAIGGATIVNLTSSTPEEARAVAAAAEEAGARYLDGAIMVPTPLIGTPNASVLYSGEAAVLDTHRGTLAAIGGGLDLVGTDPGLASLLDLGMLDVFFAGMTSFLHAAAMVGSDGISATAFQPYAEQIVDVLKGSLAGLAADVDAGSYPGHEDNLDMELAALEHIVTASAARGIDVSVPHASRRLAAAAVDAGHGRDGFARIFDAMRRPG